MSDNYLIIKSLKCFSYQEIPFRNLTVLAGSNSVGKSSVIQALLLLRLAYEKAISGANKIPLNGDYALGLGNTFNIIGRKEPSENISIAFTSNGINKQARLFADIKEAQVFLRIDEPEVPLAFQDVIPYHPILRPDFHYLNAERLGPRPFYNVTDSGRNVGYRGENTISLLSSSTVRTPEFDVTEEKRFPKTENSRLLYQVEFWMGYIIPGVKINPKKILETNQSFIQYGGSSPYNVGFGISYVLPIIVAGLIARRGEMFVVENPEAHLHPSGQSRIGKFIAMVASSGVTVVVETHSEHVINGIRIAALEQSISHKDVVINFFCSSDKVDSFQPEIKSIFLNDNADLDSWPKGFFDQQQEDIARIFKLRKQNKK